MDILSVVRKF